MADLIATPEPNDVARSIAPGLHITGIGPVDPPAPALFTFTLESFDIKNTRALFKDTDYVTFTLLVNPQGGTGKPQTLTKSMGNVDNGVHAVGLAFTNVSIAPTDTVVLNYLIVNAGHSSPGTVLSTLESAATKLATAGGTALGNLIAPGVGSILGAIAGWLAGELESILTADCDGTVAAEQQTYTYEQLVAKCGNAPFTTTTNHPGTNSADGCGSNSLYEVMWQMVDVSTMHVSRVPNLIGLDIAVAAKLVEAAGLKLVWNEHVHSGTFIGAQSPGAGSLLATGSVVSVTLRSGAPL